MTDVPIVPEHLFYVKVLTLFVRVADPNVCRWDKVLTLFVRVADPDVHRRDKS